MLKALVLAAAVAFGASAVHAQTQAPAPEPIQVMVVGAFHFDNPGMDLANAQIDPVTTPAKQAELAQVAEDLARFRPTAVAVERIATDTATLADQRWPEFTAATLTSNSDERVQIGYRLAALTGVSRVYAIDEQPDEGEHDYFPFDKVAAWAAAHGREAELNALIAEPGRLSAEMEANQRIHTLGWMLRDMNRRDHPMHGAIDFYYRLLSYGDAVEQPGAELNAGWYERNAKIFAKLMLTAKPGDRIVVVYGAGHLYWLRHFIESTPGFELVEANDYLTGR
ncbi:hypothetical protein ASG17_05465 [Brevundimonas sp. Leaf363]|uniref:DUF5694 domain-containing protein n=1 Tax=Brevundimonas sp. Leaf363 TaxID=1736353 RepID=UPI0006F69281|nr:DUF5694 domain-containing protein [Brevundimonas sp. Leaf363]KQS55527.1 hypothetical protein ASG17_05465 [Brevundimonas sp. Leaf363]